MEKVNAERKERQGGGEVKGLQKKLVGGEKCRIVPHSHNACKIKRTGNLLLFK